MKCGRLSGYLKHIAAERLNSGCCFVRPAATAADRQQADRDANRKTRDVKAVVRGCRYTAMEQTAGRSAAASRTARYRPKVNYCHLYAFR